MQPAYYSEQPGWAEHKAEGYWDAVCAACQRLWTVTDIPRSAIAGVAVTTQRGQRDQGYHEPDEAHQRLDARRQRRRPESRSCQEQRVGRVQADERADRIEEIGRASCRERV